MNSERIPRTVVTIGGSAGGVEAMIAILQKLPAGLPAVVGVVIHRSPVYGSTLVNVFARASVLPVTEPADGEAIEPGHVYLAPRDRHMLLDGDRWHLNRGPQVHRMRPAADPLFETAARWHGQRVLGILLSGGGSDGSRGLIAIKARGGLSVVQKPEEARHPSMPAHALREDDVDAVLSLDDIAAVIPVLAKGGEVGPGGMIPPPRTDHGPRIRA